MARIDLPVVPVTYEPEQVLRLLLRGAASASCGPALSPSAGSAATAARPQVESDEHPFLVRQIADDLLHRRRQVANQRRQRHDLIAARELRLLQQIDDFDPVASGQMLFADRLEIPQRRRRSRRYARRRRAAGSIRPRPPSSCAARSSCAYPRPACASQAGDRSGRGRSARTSAAPTSAPCHAISESTNGARRARPEANCAAGSMCPSATRRRLRCPVDVATRRE